MSKRRAKHAAVQQTEAFPSAAGARPAVRGSFLNGLGAQLLGSVMSRSAARGPHRRLQAQERRTRSRADRLPAGRRRSRRSRESSSPMKKARPKRPGCFESALWNGLCAVLVPQAVLDAAHGVLHLALGLIHLAFGFHLGVAENLAGRFLDAALDVLHRPFHAIFVGHYRLLRLNGMQRERSFESDVPHGGPRPHALIACRPSDGTTKALSRLD